MNIGLLFSGQGAQYPGMMKDFCVSIPSCQKILDIADSILETRLSPRIFYASQEELNQTINTQPAVFAADLIAYEALMSMISDLPVVAMAGFSLGEYSALVASGVLDQEHGFLLVEKRAYAMQAAAPVGSGAMGAIMKADEDEVRLFCQDVGGYVIPVNFNCPGQIVISGEVEAVDAAVANAKAAGKRAMRLPVSVPCHCILMDGASGVLEEELEKIPFHVPSCVVYENTDGCRVGDVQDLKARLVRQVKSPVYWQKTLENMWNDGVDTFIELGPGKTLSTFVKRTLPDARIYNVSDLATLETTVTSLTSIGDNDEYN